jgi:hypothetical protein
MKKKMTEEFLQYIWKHSLFENENLTTTSGDPIEILNSGTWNTDAGPDFFNASIKINKTLWAGNVEVHLQSSDWLAHGHQNDPSYNNVILHVVLNNNKEIEPKGREAIPVFIPKIKHDVIDNYTHLISQKSWPACYETISEINPVYLYNTFDSLLVERLEQKTSLIVKTLQGNKNNWNETFYQHLARSFGFKTNSLPFEMLARSLPLAVLAKHKSNLFQLESLLFGQSGLLNEQLLGDDYFLKLREEYSYLSSKYQLKGMEGHIWKFLRMRPSNFPTIRIAQFAALLHHSESLLSKLTEEKGVKDIIKFFEVKASEYWDTHYHFNNVSEKKPKWLGESSRDNLLINTVAPFLFIYGERNEKENLKQRAIDILELLPPEKNNITSRWSELGIPTKNSFDTQALIQLKNNYCENKNCLNCQIGKKIIDRS